MWVAVEERARGVSGPGGGVIGRPDDRRRPRDLWPLVAATVGVSFLLLAVLTGPAFALSDLPLKQLLANHGVVAGAEIEASPFLTDPAYKTTLLREYAMVVPGNELKWDETEPQRGVFTFAQADSMLQPLAAAGMKLRGTPLVWHTQLPTWLTGGTWTRDELLQILHDHITALVTHYRGQISQWDVVNEAVGDGGGYRDNIWYQVIGPEYIDDAFIWAHEADPSAKLYLNDYGNEALGVKSDAFYNLVSDLKSRGIPIDGVGLQAHVWLGGMPSEADMVSSMNRLASLGVDIAVSELDVRLQIPTVAGFNSPVGPSASDLQAQRGAYASVAEACASVPACKTFLTWGFTDRYSWIPSFYAGWGAALPFDEQYQPKPAYYGIKDGFGERPGDAAFYESPNAQHDNGLQSSPESWTLVANGCERGFIDVGSGQQPLVSFIARGPTVAGVAPQASVTVDGQSAGTVASVSSNWTAYEVATSPLTRGWHEVDVCFTNDYVGPEGDRNLELARVAITSQFAPTDMEDQSSGSPSAGGWTGGVGAQVQQPFDIVNYGRYRLRITARATNASAGIPAVQATVDGVVVGSADVTSSALSDKVVDVVLPPGRHLVGVSIARGSTTISTPSPVEVSRVAVDAAPPATS